MGPEHNRQLNRGDLIKPGVIDWPLVPAQRGQPPARRRRSIPSEAPPPGFGAVRGPAALARRYRRRNRQRGDPGAAWLAMFTGLLREEVLTLSWRHVDRKAGVFRVRHARGVLSSELPVTSTGAVPPAGARRPAGSPPAIPTTGRSTGSANPPPTESGSRLPPHLEGARVATVRMLAGSARSRLRSLNEMPPATRTAEATSLADRDGPWFRCYGADGCRGRRRERSTRVRSSAVALAACRRYGRPGVGVNPPTVC